MSGANDPADVARPKEISGCRNCRRRRIKCDGTEPACAKCIRKGLTCTGYGVRYKFASNAVIETRDIPVASQHGNDPSTRPATLLWPDGTRTAVRQCTSPKDRSRPIHALTDDSSASRLTPNPDSDTVTSQSSTDEGWTVARIPQTTNALGETREVLTSLGQANHAHGLSVPHALESLDAGTRELFSHFSTAIAPIMVVADSPFNGYRNLLLPLACEDELVRATICVASLDLLAQKQPHLQRKAELGLQRILNQLRKRTSARNDLVDLSAWAAVILLLTAETITGGANLPYLFKILRHLEAANTSHGKMSVMHTFLAEQTRMMTLFAQPLLDETSGALALQQRSDLSMDFISNVAIFLPELSKELEIYSAAINIACSLYITRASKNPPHSDTIPDVERLKSLCQPVSPSTPGHHTLVWVYFIAAAESSTLEHRQFFSDRLRQVYSCTGFHNIPIALDALQTIWRMQGARRWTSLLLEIMPVFII